MADILLLQDAEPPFRLAAWVLREEGHDVRIISSPDEAVSELSIVPPALAVLNLSGTEDYQRNAVAILRVVTHEAPVIHITELEHENTSCFCDAILQPPYSGQVLLEQVGQLLAGP